MQGLRRTVVVCKDIKNLHKDFVNGYVSKNDFNSLSELVLEGGTSFCTPKCHLFPAYLKSIEVSNSSAKPSVEYLVEYSYSEFIDRKYNKKSLRTPSWARISFSITCPSCGKIKNTSTQTNIVRPYSCVCSCEYVLFQELSTNPVIEDL